MTLRPNATLEKLLSRGEGHLPGLIGFRPTAIAEGRVDAELEIRPELLAPNGYLHAATIVALADTACGYGCLAHLPPGAENFTTIELKVNFLGTAREGKLTCVAKPVHLGSTTQIWDAVVTDPAKDRTLALFRCTQLILWPRRT